jgi:hypothetical protein
MAFVNEFEYNQFYINLKAEKIVKYINEYLADIELSVFSSDNVELTELTYDPLYDEFLPHGNASHMWKIELSYDDDSARLFFNYDTFYAAPRYEILISFLEGTDDEPSFIDFTNNSNVRSYFCDSIIKQIKCLLKKEEKATENRYSEREPLLILINGCVINYHDFDDVNLEQAQTEKMTSKKRCVLENPWFQREILEHLDHNDNTSIVSEFLIK